jgi:hypothetical protein
VCGDSGGCRDFAGGRGVAADFVLYVKLDSSSLCASGSSVAVTVPCQQDDLNWCVCHRTWQNRTNK